jgi:hypothetical protein
MVKNLVNCNTLAYLQALRTCFNINNIRRNYGIFDKLIPKELKKVENL